MDARGFIETVRKNRDLSFRDFSNILGYKSKTSLARLMRGESNLRSMESFGQRVKEHFDLSPDEQNMLAQLLQYARSGNSDAALEMEAFLRMDEPIKADILISDNSGKTQTLDARYDNLRNMRVIIANCQYVPMYTTLCTWIREKDARIEHYMVIRDDPARSIHSMTVLLPVVYEKNYAGYVMKDPLEHTVCGMQTADSMLVSYTLPDGGSREEIIIFDSALHGYVFESAGNNYSARAFALPWNGYSPIKRTYFQYTKLDDYMRYSKECAELEKDCAQYIIAPDPCITMMPVSVLKAAFLDKQGDVPPSLVDDLTGIYEQRFINAAQKRNPTHYIMKRSAMRSFIRTGQTQDHFWGMRPFNPSERVLIMENLIEQFERNPYCNLYFLADDDFLRNMQMCCYEGHGLLILDAQTSFNLADDHAEILITQEEFLEHYKQYFLKYLIKDSVISPEMTRDFLYECLKYCKSCDV